MYVLFSVHARTFVLYLIHARENPMASALTYDDLKDTISRVYPTLSKQLQLIARFALDKPNELALGTVAAVAEAAGVQPSALIRFANALEFGGFSEMQQVFREHLVGIEHAVASDMALRHTAFAFLKQVRKNSFVNYRNALGSICQREADGQAIVVTLQSLFLN